MKTKLSYIAIFLLTVLAPSASFAQKTLKDDPAYIPIDELIDLKKITPEVNVNLPKFLLNNVINDLNSGPNNPFTEAGINLKELLGGVKLIRVVVIEADNENREALENATAKLRGELEKTWTPIVSVPEENVGIYALSDATGETMAGIALVINDDGDAVLGNIVGEVPLGKLLRIAAGLKEGLIPKDILAKLATGGLEAAGGDGADGEASVPTEPESKADEQ